MPGTTPPFAVSAARRLLPILDRAEALLKDRGFVYAIPTLNGPLTFECALQCAASTYVKRSFDRGNGIPHSRENDRVLKRLDYLANAHGRSLSDLPLSAPSTQKNPGIWAVQTLRRQLLKDIPELRTTPTPVQSSQA